MLKLTTQKGNINQNNNLVAIFTYQIGKSFFIIIPRVCGFK